MRHRRRIREERATVVTYHYVWLLWASAFLIPWSVLFAGNPGLRRVMWQASAVTALFGLTEPVFVPRYWNPPSLFDLAQRTGFDLESLIFTFAIGGIGAAAYTTLAHRVHAPVADDERNRRRHRFHRAMLVAPFVFFVPLWMLRWNPIYPSIVCLLLGSLGALACRRDLARPTLVGGILFLCLYAAFMLGLRWLAPGYIAHTWNLSALNGGLVYGIPLEELLFGMSFGMYWSTVYEHVTWHELHARRSTMSRRQVT